MYLYKCYGQHAFSPQTLYYLNIILVTLMRLSFTVVSKLI